MSAVESREQLHLARERLAALGGVVKPVYAFLAAGAIFLVVGLAQGTVYGSLALALVLIYRATEIINFAQGEMAMATTYFAYQLTAVWGISYWLAFALTLLFAFVFGTVVQLVFVRPVQHKSVIAVVIVTVGLFILIDGVVEWVWGADIKFMPAPFGNAVYHLGGVAIARQDIGTLAVTIVSVGVLWLLFQRTKVGLGMRAAALRPASARLVGVRVDRMLALGWGLAAVLGAIAGLMGEAYSYSLQPSFMQPILLYAFAAAVLGGLESPVGALVGGIALGIFLNLVGQYVHFVTSELRLPFAFAVLLVVLLIKPSGLFGRKRVRKV